MDTDALWLPAGKVVSSVALRSVGLLAGGAMTDAALLALGTCSRLVRLDISGSSVTDTGLAALVCGSAAAASLQEADVTSCRGLERATRTAAATGLRELRGHLQRKRS